MKQLDLTVLFLLKDDQVLLAMKKRGFGEGNWNGVGGKIEPGETIEEALIREAQEEIGVTPLKPKKVGFIVFNEIHNDERKLMHVNVYTAESWSGEITESEEMRPKWFKKTDIPYNKMWADDPYWLPQVLENKLIKAEFTLGDNNEILEHSVQEVTSLD